MSQKKRNITTQNKIEQQTKLNKLASARQISLDKPGHISERTIPSVSWSLRGQIQLEDTAEPAAGYLVKVFAEDMADRKQPLAQVVTNADGCWSIALQHFEQADELIHKMREKDQPELYVEIYEPEGELCRQIKISKDIDWKKPQTLVIPKPDIRGLITRDLMVSGRVINCHKKLPCKRLRVEVWDPNLDQEVSLAEASVHDDGIFETRIPAEKVVGRFKNYPVLWLRVRDSKDGAILVTSYAPLAFNKKGEAIEELCLPKRLPTPTPVFNAHKRLTAIRLNFSPEDFRKLGSAGIRTVRDVAKVKSVDRARKTEIKVERLEMLIEFCKNSLAQLALNSAKRRVFGQTPLTQIGLKYLPISRSSLMPIEDIWGYRFACWDREVDGISTAERYLDLLKRETGFSPRWRTQMLKEWLDDRQPWWERYGIDANAVRNVLEPCDSPFTYAKRRLEILTALGLFEDGQEETGFGLIGSLNQSIKDMENKPIDELRITTWTGNNENDGTDGLVLYDAIFLYQAGHVVGYSGLELNNSGDDREKGKRDDYTFFSRSSPLIAEGDRSPRISLQGKGGWMLQDWHIEVVHNGLSYTKLSGLNSPVWLDSDDNSDWCTLNIGPWNNPFTYWRDQLAKIIVDLKAFVRGLDNVNRFAFGSDDVLSLILDGNKEFLLENYPLAIQKYREAESRLGQLRVTSDEYQQILYREKPAYDRLHYLISLHIGDCYWGCREYERAIQYFLTEASRKRNFGSFDDQFLWNHVAKCILDWADHRYRAAGDNQQKRYEFGSVENTTNPIDPDHPYIPVDTRGAHKLYLWILERCFHCGVTSQFEWHQFVTELARRRLNRIAIVLVKAEAADLVRMKSLYIKLGDRQETPLTYDKDLARRLKVAAVFISKVMEPLNDEDFTDIILRSACSQPIPFVGLKVLGFSQNAGQPSNIFENIQYRNSFNASDILRITQIVPWWGRQTIPDLHPSETNYETMSDLLLLRANTGVTSINAGLNVMGLRDDYVPAYRYNVLKDWAQQAISDVKTAGDLYISYKQMIAQTMDNRDAKEHALQVAQMNIGIGETLEKLAKGEIEISEGRVEAIKNQQLRLEEKEAEIEKLGAIQFYGAMFGMLANTLQGGLSGSALENKSSGALVGGLGGVLGFANGAFNLAATSLNTTNNLNDIRREIEQLKDSQALAEMEVRQTMLGQLIQAQRNDIAILEASFLRDQLEQAEGESFSNPEIWYQVSKIQRRLFFSAMARALFACWMVQKAIEFEIEVGLQPQPIYLPNGDTINWRPILFDYLDNVLTPSSAPGEYRDGDENVQVSPLIAAITGAGRLQDDFANLVLYRQVWYEFNVPKFVGTEILFSRKFPFQLGQIQTTPGRLARVHFSTKVRFFDEIAAGHAAYGRLFYVQAFYDASTGDSSAFAGELTNSYVTETGDRTNLSYWRVPAKTSNPESNDVHYLNDWLDYSGSTERWGLKSKPTAPTNTDANIIQVYNLGSAIGQEVYQIQKEQNLNFVNTFENTGLQTDWTLTLRIPESSQAVFSEISDLKLVFVWTASANTQLEALINAQFDIGVKGKTYIRHFKQAPEHEFFEQIFDPYNKYTDQIGLPGNRIDFTILPDGTLPGQNRQIKSVYLAFFFDEAIIPLANIPSLTVRLTKTAVVDASGSPVEITFDSPTQTQQPPFQLPLEFVDQDPVGAWTFQMLSNDNMDPINNQPKSLHGLADIILLIEYEYVNQ